MHGIQMWWNLNSIYVFKPQHPEWWAQYEVEADSVKGDSDLMVDSDDKFSDKGWHGICQFVAGWTETKKDIQKPLQTRKYLDSMEME